VTDAPISLAADARERARAIAPAVWVGLTFYIAASSRFDVGLSRLGVALELALLAALSVMVVAIRRRRIPLRFTFLASATLVWAPILATLVALYCGKNPSLFVFLVFQTACTGLILDTRIVVGTLVTTLALALPFLLALDHRRFNVYLLVLPSSSMFALWIHIVFRRMLLRAEANRAALAETNEKLALQLCELEVAYTQREQLQDQLLHAQRMEAIGTLSAGLAHDMNNVLASITSVAELALSDTSDDTARENLRHIIDQGARGGALTRGLLTFSRRNRYRKQVVRAADVMRQVIPLLERTLPRAIDLVTTIHDDDVSVKGDPIHLGQMIMNLALNATEAMDGAGTLAIALEVVPVVTHTTLQPGNYVCISVRDTGRGMDEATRSRAFEPFFTTKAIGEGNGLGLSTVWGVVRGHDGAIDVDSSVGKGTTFTVLLPISFEAPAALIKPATTGPIRRATVLVVDDEQSVRDSACRLLQRMGLRTLTACNGEEALAVFGDNANTVELVMLDMGMPVMGGAQCFRELRELRPDLPVLVCTGYAVEQDAQALIAAGARLLEKPYTANDLRKEVALLLGEARGAVGLAQ
jgi:signal transduction histidine kinase/ActR/RegA family two-component response regulator